MLCTWQPLPLLVRHGMLRFPEQQETVWSRGVPGIPPQGFRTCLECSRCKREKGRAPYQLTLCAMRPGGKPHASPQQKKPGPAATGLPPMSALAWALTVELLQPVLGFLLQAQALQAWEIEERRQTCHYQKCTSATYIFPKDCILKREKEFQVQPRAGLA